MPNPIQQAVEKSDKKLDECFEHFYSMKNSIHQRDKAIIQAVIDSLPEKDYRQKMIINNYLTKLNRIS